MPKYITPIDATEALVEGFGLLRNGDLTDNRLIAGGLTIGAAAAKATVGWPEEPASNRLELISEEELARYVQYREALHAVLSNPPAAGVEGTPAGAEAIKLSDPRILAMLAVVLELVDDLLASRTAKAAAPGPKGSP